MRKLIIKNDLKKELKNATHLLTILVLNQTKNRTQSIHRHISYSERIFMAHLLPFFAFSFRLAHLL